MSQTQSIREQLCANAVALISLFVALTSLGYNTWRNERTEENRNVRVAAFEVLRELGELQLTVNLAFFAQDHSSGHPLAGWGRVAMISDLCEVLPAPAREQAKRLHDVWQANWRQLGDDETSVDRISAEIDSTRAAIREILRRLH
jgi:hypothetical protein